MTDFQIAENEVQTIDPALARLFEAEIQEAALAMSRGGTCRIGLDKAADGSLDRVSIVLTDADTVVEFRIALPAVPGDVRRATESALLGRRTPERRHAARALLDRRQRRS